MMNYCSEVLSHYFYDHEDTLVVVESLYAVDDVIMHVNLEDTNLCDHVGHLVF